MFDHGAWIIDNVMTFARPGVFIKYSSAEKTHAVVLWNDGELDQMMPVNDIAPDPRMMGEHKLRVRLGVLREFLRKAFMRLGS